MNEFIKPREDNWVSDLLSEDLGLELEEVNGYKAEKSFQRYANYVRNENAKREKIYDLFSTLQTSEVIMVLSMFMPGVTARTIMAGMNNQMLDIPNRP